MIDLKFATMERTPEGAVSHFFDGASYGAQPHDKPHYHAVAHRLGYEGDIATYCVEHELAHHVVAESFNRRSSVLWELAHGERPDRYSAACEEGLAMALQRYARANEQPFIDGIDWQALKARFLRLAMGLS